MKSDFPLGEGRTKNDNFYEGQVWRDLGDMNCGIKLTVRSEGFTNIYLNFFFLSFFLTLVLNTDPVDLDICGTLCYTYQ